MVRAAGIALLLLLAGADRPATEEEKVAAERGYFECLSSAARKLDDGGSDAATIGGAIGPLCRPELRVAADTVSRGQNRRVGAMFFDRRVAEESSLGTAIVLKGRRERSAN